MLQNMRIRTKLFASFGIVITFLIFVGLFAILQMTTLSNVTTKLYNHPLIVSNAVRDVNINIVKIHRSMKDIALSKDAKSIETTVKIVNNYEQAVYASFDIITERFLGDKQDVNALKTLFTDWKPIRDKVIELVRNKQIEQAASITKKKGAKHVANLEVAMDKLIDFANNKAIQFLDNANTQKNQLILLVSIFMLVAIVIGIWISVIISGTIANSVNQAITFANSIASGDLTNDIKFNTKTETGRLLQALDAMQLQLQQRIKELDNTQKKLQERMEEDKRIATEALRINRALDKVITSVLITDSTYKIIYINDAALRLFTHQEDQICTHLPHFNANKLIDGNIDIFYQNPTQQRQLLTNLIDSHHDTLNLGDLTIDTTMTPVINKGGERLGTVFEFKDRTLEVATEQEINSVIHAASQGDFQQRIVTTDKADFFKIFSESINQIIEINQVVTEDVMRMFAALSQGDLTQKIETDYTGIFTHLKNDANVTVENLTEIMQEILQQTETVNNASNEISSGNISLSQRTEEQAASLEETSASMEQMTGTVQQNADNSKYAAQLAINARDQAEKGGVVVNSTITAMTEIVVAVKKVNDIITEIASASQEQASGINQVNDAVAQMDEMTQQNATLVEELSTSSNVMKDQVQSLTNLVSFFKIRKTKKDYQKIATSKPIKTIATLRSKKDNQENGWEDF
ncbi:MAG: MCP four helix bundle domain-containing protein [Proteobacteria bacterium]|nr:MCP four helix bundle domain-containing protein [Pseudomonadota bacterium]